MKFRNALTTAVCTIILFAACKKDNTTQPSSNNNNNNNTTPKTQAELLADGKWQMSSYFVAFTTNGIPFNVNVYDSMDACQKDDFYLYKTTGKLYIDNGATKCDAAAPQVDSSYSWQLAGSKLSWTFGVDKMEYDVLALDSAQLKTSMKYYDTSSTTNYTYTITYKNIK